MRLHTWGEGEGGGPRGKKTCFDCACAASFQSIHVSTLQYIDSSGGEDNRGENVLTQGSNARERGRGERSIRSCKKPV